MSEPTTFNLPTRLRRLRQHPAARDLICETHVSVNDLIYPIFIVAGSDIKQEIRSMPGQYQWSIDRLPELLDTVISAGISSVLLFGLPDVKDAQGSSSWHDAGVVQQACRVIRQHAPELFCIVDVCFCEYTTHGHCGVITKNARGQLGVDNDTTLTNLGKQALSLAHAGADMLAPSGMMDGMVAAIRQVLDANDFSMLPIMSYAVKFASNLYGPFRDAADGAPQFGDRRGYQMNPANGNLAMREAELDIQEGADILMVKPAGYYLDVVSRVKNKWPAVPLAAYQVSGEYAMLKLAIKHDFADAESLMLESLIAIKRAGADCIISYFAVEAARLLQKR